MTARPRQIIATDANVLINLMHVSRLELCARLPDYQFVVPDHVQCEIANTEQRDTLNCDPSNVRVIPVPEARDRWIELVDQSLCLVGDTAACFYLPSTAEMLLNRTDGNRAIVEDVRAVRCRRLRCGLT